VSAVAAAGVLPLAGPAGALPPVAEGAAMPDLSSSDLSSGSSSESDSDSERRKRKARCVVAKSPDAAVMLCTVCKASAQGPDARLLARTGHVVCAHLSSPDRKRSDEN